MTNKEKALYFKKQALETLDEYKYDNTVTPRHDNVVYAEKLFKINSVYNHIAKLIESGQSENDKSRLLYLLGTIDKYAKGQNNVQWFNGELLTLNKGE